MQLKAVPLLIPSSVEVMAVSKTQNIEKICHLIEQGYRLFGENRVQAAWEKWPALLTQFPECRLHLIGHLQSNKAKQAVELFHSIEVINRPSLVDALIKHLSLPTAKTQEFLIQVNIGEEPQKTGVHPNNFPDLYQYCKNKNLPIHGLMCIPPADQDPSPYFEKLKNMAQCHNLKILSMGMSQDYETAIKYGSTRIRLGTALFGSR
ncbi:YggS family pyridoxal phosphate-dependent enzyme [Candidatus Paracaedibacter acanthamoebae]|uniref:YggS family pyridoxal phosphate-dependent enzyme n=1 Tax=Candidatus Odyssella acanthamoebae TaxID=91604 RepID=UPI000A0687AA|nr:YggS family pyridoxal phosphate-dependent enzyme [Candidatus Paracaedibacter acanthamoebae]